MFRVKARSKGGRTAADAAWGRRDTVKFGKRVSSPSSRIPGYQGVTIETFSSKRRQRAATKIRALRRVGNRVGAKRVSTANYLKELRSERGAWGGKLNKKVGRSIRSTYRSAKQRAASVRNLQKARSARRRSPKR